MMSNLQATWTMFDACLEVKSMQQFVQRHLRTFFLGVTDQRLSLGHWTGALAFHVAFGTLHHLITMASLFYFLSAVVVAC